MRGKIMGIISNLILDEFKKAPDKIMVATKTLNVTGFPDISIKDK